MGTLDVINGTRRSDIATQCVSKLLGDSNVLLTLMPRPMATMISALKDPRPVYFLERGFRIMRILANFDFLFLYRRPTSLRCLIGRKPLTGR